MVYIGAEFDAISKTWIERPWDFLSSCQYITPCAIHAIPVSNRPILVPLKEELLRKKLYKEDYQQTCSMIHFLISTPIIIFFLQMEFLGIRFFVHFKIRGTISAFN